MTLFVIAIFFFIFDWFCFYIHSLSVLLSFFTIWRSGIIIIVIIIIIVLSLIIVFLRREFKKEKDVET